MARCSDVWSNVLFTPACEVYSGRDHLHTHTQTPTVCRVIITRGRKEESERARNCEGDSEIDGQKHRERARP